MIEKMKDKIFNIIGKILYPKSKGIKDCIVGEARIRTYHPKKKDDVEWRTYNLELTERIAMLIGHELIARGLIDIKMTETESGCLKVECAVEAIKPELGEPYERR